MEPSTLVLAIIYAVAAGGTVAPSLGARLGPDREIPEAARGLLVPDYGVVQLRESSSLSTTGRLGVFRFRSGVARFIADASMTVLVDDLEVTVGSGGEATVQKMPTGRGETTICAVRGEVIIAGHAAHSDISPPQRVTVGSCWIEGRDQQQPLASELVEALRQGVESSPLQPVELPDVVGDLAEHLTSVEAEWNDALSQGPRREAQSCGCAENGGSTGGFDPTGPSLPISEPEQLEPGRVRIILRIPNR